MGEPAKVENNTELNADGTPKVAPAATNDDKVKVPLYKFQKQLERTKELEAQLAKIEADKAAEAKAKLEAEGKVKELLDQTTKELTQTKQALTDMTEKQKKQAITQALKTVIVGNQAHDASVVLGLIDNSKLEVEETDGEIVIKNVDGLIADLKKSKPFLFKDGTPGGAPNNVNPNENGKTTQGIDALRVEFKSLFDKPSLTGPERKRFEELGKLIQDNDKKK